MSQQSQASWLKISGRPLESGKPLDASSHAADAKLAVDRFSVSAYSGLPLTCARVRVRVSFSERKRASAPAGGAARAQAAPRQRPRAAPQSLGSW